MRGAWTNNYEYILELHTERRRVGCDGTTHVTVSRVLSDTCRGIRCELDMNKGGTARLYPRPLNDCLRTRFFRPLEKKENGGKEYGNL